jgi:Spy/CpxP family protein refolding chaperone
MPQPQQLPDAIGDNLYSPELIRQAHDSIELTSVQEVSLKDAINDVQPRIGELQQEMEAETEKLVALLKKDHVDENAVLAQADKVMNLERDLKRTQLGMFIKLKNTLTPQQQAKLRAIKNQTPSPGLQAKMREAQELAEKWRAEGRDLSALHKSRQEFESLLKAGKTREAEATLDKTLRTLREPKK